MHARTRDDGKGWTWVQRMCLGQENAIQLKKMPASTSGILSWERSELMS